MFNKFEAVGIGLSVAIMALALFLLRIESTPGASVVVNSDEQVGLVVVSQDGERDTALRNALVEATDDRGNVEQLLVNDVIVGSGRTVAHGDTVSVHYIGTLRNGQEFDNSNKRGEPFTFTVGAGQVIQGWDQGLVGMQVGGQRILVIPSELGYGSRAVGPIPPNSTLVFSIELVAIE
jgi:FKBP-type peptidyl-prolyl cis-trans isomerase